MGTVKASILVGDSKCSGIVTLSFYDSDSVYFISNACEKIEWTQKNRKLWHKGKGIKMNAPF